MCPYCCQLMDDSLCVCEALPEMRCRKENQGIAWLIVQTQNCLQPGVDKVQRFRAAPTGIHLSSWKSLWKMRRGRNFKFVNRECNFFSSIEPLGIILDGGMVGRRCLGSEKISAVEGWKDPTPTSFHRHGTHRSQQGKKHTSGKKREDTYDGLNSNSFCIEQSNMSLRSLHSDGYISHILTAR